MPRSPGLKASAPNEVWHIDVTEILSLDGNKHFLQVVYDNYSRYVIAWSLNDRICAANTERLLKRARRKTVVAMDKSLLIVDGGSENTAQRVSAAIARFKPQMIRRIARKEIKNSNTMIEIFFKMLKSNHLKFVVLRHRCDVAREVAFYVHQHNNIVPMRVLAGDTPAETLYCDGGKNSSEAVAETLNSRRIERVAENQSGFCQICL
jgi:transposase InsO family protein